MVVRVFIDVFTLHLSRRAFIETFFYLFFSRSKSKTSLPQAEFNDDEENIQNTAIHIHTYHSIRLYVSYMIVFGFDDEEWDLRGWMSGDD